MENIKDRTSRKIQLTLNNPDTYDYTYEYIREALKEMKIEYYCMSREVGANGTPHIHVFMYRKGAIKFSVVKKRFPKGHIEESKGTVEQNIDYVFKHGKYAEKLEKKDGKAQAINFEDSHEEYGEVPIERQGRRSDLADLYDEIKSGKSVFEIVEENPCYAFQTDKIKGLQSLLLEEEYSNKWRDITTEYIYGDTGTGKSRYVMESTGNYRDIYRVTDYAHPFDQYNYQDIILFEEFRSSLPLQDMLKYLDGYPITLPCRFSNKPACFTKIYIVSNIPIDAQYRNVQIEEKKSYDAFLRRIHKITHFPLKNCG